MRSEVTKAGKQDTMKRAIRKAKEKTGDLYRNFYQLLLVGTVTGIFAGAVTTVFNILVHEGEQISRNVYAYVRANPAFLPLLALGFIGGAFLIGVAVNISSVIRGCGIPQAEGGTRGHIRFKWWRDMTLMFASCLLSIFMGLSIGPEGPSVFIGACAGDGMASAFRRNQMIRKYQVAGGACVGLAVASNAPLTGVAFAFEEAYKRLTPEVLICSFTSVIFGMLTRSAIYAALGMEATNAFSSYVFHDMDVGSYRYALGAGLVCGIAGVIFYKLCFVMRALFKKVNAKNPRFTHSTRILIAVLLGGCVSLLAVGAMGSGHDLIEKIGSGSATQVDRVFDLPLLWSLLIILILRFFITSVNVGAGIPCGIFIPMIAIGACLGALLNGLWVKIGMDPQFCDLMVMLCMSAFFTTVVKAPITSIVMICEFTGSFAHLLPVIIAVAVGYIIGEMFHTDGIYEELLEQYEQETSVHEKAVSQVFVLGLAKGALADKREVRDILWPSGARVVEIERGEERILPDGDTVLQGGDVLKIVVKTSDPKEVKDELSHILN